MKFALSALAVVFVSAPLLAQQAASPSAASAAPPVLTMGQSLKGSYTYVRDNMIKMVDKMPAELYSYQPTPEMKTFAANVAHIAQSNIGQCSTLAGHPHELRGQDLTKTMTTKEPLVAAIKSGFALCDEYFNTMTDDAALMKLADITMMKDGQRTPAKAEFGGSAAGLLSHTNEMYGYMSVYLRLKGIVPPTSEKK